MLTRLQPVLKILNVLIVLGIAVAVVGLVKTVVFAPKTPRTEIERASFVAEEAVRANPDDPTARIKLASAYLEQGALGAAEKQAKIAIRLAPKDPSGQYILGLVLSRRGDYKEAIKALEKSVSNKGQLAGFYSDAFAALAVAQDKGGNKKHALVAMDYAINYAPENSLFLYQRGQMYEARKRWADALYDYGIALEYTPDYEDALNAYRRLSDKHPEALKEMQKKFKLETTPTAK